MDNSDNSNEGKIGEFGSYRVAQQQILSNAIKTRHLAVTDIVSRGDLYYGDGSNNFVRLAPGQAGQFLTTQGEGADLEWTTYTPPTPTGRYLQTSGVVPLINTFNSVANTNEQEATELKVTLPIVSATCTVIVGLTMYVGYPAGNSNVRIRVGTSGTFGSNTEYGQSYSGGSFSASQFIMAIATVSLATQTYVNVTVQNDASNSVALSATLNRTAVWYQVFYS